MEHSGEAVLPPRPPWGLPLPAAVVLIALITGSFLAHFALRNPQALLLGSPHTEVRLGPLLSPNRGDPGAHLAQVDFLGGEAVKDGCWVWGLKVSIWKVQLGSLEFRRPGWRLPGQKLSWGAGGSKELLHREAPSGTGAGTM